jgi:hypothetical protein
LDRKPRSHNANAVGTDDYADLPFSTALELDADAFTIGHQRPHFVTEDHFDVIGEQNRQRALHSAKIRG